MANMCATSHAHGEAQTMMQFTRRPLISWLSLDGRERRNWCGLCRHKAGGLFDVPHDVWMHYVGADQRHQLLCIHCWHWLVDAIDGGAFEAAHGGPVPLWSAEFRRRHHIPADEPATQGLSPWFTVSHAACRPRFRR
jgi:hypothetical protein